LTPATNFNQKFLDIFTKKEFNEIVANTSLLAEDCIILLTEAYFFELSADIGETLKIYCIDNETDVGKLLTKEQFLTLYKKSKPVEPLRMVIDA
jgi:hypothetical protein